MKHNIGITEQHRGAICESLGRVLAGSYALQLQAQYASQIQQKSSTIDASQILALVRGS